MQVGCDGLQVFALGLTHGNQGDTVCLLEWPLGQQLTGHGPGVGLLKSQAFQQWARHRRAQLVFAEDKAATAISYQGSSTSEHQTTEQAEGDDALFVGCDRVVEQGGSGDQLPGVGLAGLLELERQKGGFQLVEGGGSLLAVRSSSLNCRMSSWACSLLAGCWPGNVRLPPAVTSM